MNNKNSTQEKKHYFRTDIEGFRAIAVLLVIGSHYSIPGMTAGFIGVDLFFVISGYLITGLLAEEYKRTNHIALSRFYANRFRRLSPALATMLVVSSTAAYFFLPALQNLSQSNAAAMAATWVSNLYFAFSDLDYFQAETTTNVFLHTWSLGVEEQFYLIWPLLILISIKTFWTKKISSRLWLLFIIIAATSLCACLIIASNKPALAFYLMPTRAWQFSAGAMTWLLVQKKPPHQVGKVGIFGTFTGFAFLFSTLVLIDHETIYPSAIALLPTIAACAWLWSASNKYSTLHKALSLAPLQWLGKLSYSLYLWHWPVLILANHLILVKDNPANTILAIGASLLLAIITYHFIENPLRYGRAKQVKPLLQVASTLALMALLTAQFHNWNIQTQENLKRKSLYLAAASDAPTIYPDGCDDWYLSDTVNPCIYGNLKAKKTAALIGDSIAAQWFSTLERLFDLNDWRIIVLTKSSCPMIDKSFFYKRIGREYTECSTWRNNAITWLIEEKPNIIFTGSSASVPFSDKEIIHGTNRFLEKLSPASKEIYLIEPNPVLLQNGPQCLMQHEPENQHQCIGNERKNEQYQHIASLLKSTTAQHENTFWIETASYVCPKGKCSAKRDEMVIFRDNQHLTATFAASAATHFSSQLEERSEKRGS